MWPPEKENLEKLKFLPIKNVSHGIAWVIWAFFFADGLYRLLSPYIEPATDIKNYDWINILIASVFVVAILEGGVTILIRYLAILRPYKNRNYNPHDSFARFFMICFINWFLASSLPVYGLILYYMSGFWGVHFILGIMGMLLIIYHSPRLKPFTESNNLVQSEKEETEDYQGNKT